MPAFPGTVVPSIWFDGNQPAYTDASGTVLAGVGDLVRRVNEASPLSGAWTSPSDAERPYRDSNSVRLECIGSAGGYQLTRPAGGSISSADCTLVVSYVARDNAFAGPVMGLFRSDDVNVGIRIASNQVWIYYNAATNWFTPLTIEHGQRNTIVVRFTATTIDILVNAGGTISTASLTATVTPTTIAAAWRLGLDGTGNMYGSVAQAMAVARAVDNTERDALAAWAHDQTAPVAYPTDRPLIVYIGDSITRGTATTYSNCYPFRCMTSLRALGYQVETCDVAVGGTGVSRLLSPTVPNNDLLMRGAAFYSASRAKNIAVIALGTNDLANGNSTGFVLNGTSPPSGYPGSGIYPACDYLRSLGFKVVLLTVGPRTNAMGVSQAVYNSTRATVNNDLAANWASHADAFVDTRGITNYGGDSDSDNATYYSGDKIHPVDAGHALLAPSVTTALAALLAATPPPPPPPTSFTTKYQMQGRATATGAVVSWLSVNPDWVGALAPAAVTDVVIYARPRAGRS